MATVPAGEADSSVFRTAGISFLRIPAGDARLTADFYRSAFGWNVDTDRPDPSFEDGSGHVIGHFVADSVGAGESGVRPYVYVESVDDALERVTAHGGAEGDGPDSQAGLWVGCFPETG